MINEIFVVEEICDKRENEHERKTMKWIGVVSFCVYVHYGRICAMHDKGVDKLMERGWWNSRKEPGDERVGKREKKGKSGLREKSIFLLFV